VKLNKMSNESNQKGIALMLGGGAPNLTLMSGAIAALDEEMEKSGLEFSVVSTAGAGMVVGLLYAAPKGMTRREALESTKNMGVHDSIYNLFPVNYKVFHKSGPLAEAYTQFLASLPKMPMMDSPSGKFFNDWMALMLSAMCPDTVDPGAQGLCQPAPWINEVVDFDKLKNFPADFYINAYNVTDQLMESFSKQEITPDHFHAALAFPLIYAPFKMNGKTYIEGSAMDTQNFEALTTRREALDKNGEKSKKVDTLIVLDVLGREKLIREPRNLYDAWVLSIIVPLVAIARDDIRLFQYVHNQDKKWNLLRVNLTKDITEDRWPHVLDWSRSNLDYLFEVGYKGGKRFFKEAWDENEEMENFKKWEKKEGQKEGRFVSRPKNPSSQSGKTSPRARKRKK